MNIIPTLTLEAGLGWAGNSVNTAIYRQGLASRGEYQYTAFYTLEKELVIVQRRLTDNTLVRRVIDTVSTLADAHLTASIGIDGLGCVHVCYHHHNGSLNYRRMAVPADMDSFSLREPMTSCFEDKVCYPFFLCGPQNDEAFFFIYRNGVSGNGEIRLKRYDQSCGRWHDDEQPILSGMLQHPWTSNPYLQTPVMDIDGCIHLFTTWRTHSLGQRKRVNNINIDYLAGRNHGREWTTSRGCELRRPVTQVNSETAVAVSPGSNLMNQSGAALDRMGQPLTVYYTDDAHGVPQYFITRLRDGAWQTVQISARSEAFALEGGGTLQVPISRPDVVVLPDNRPVMIYRADTTQQRLVALVLNEATLLPEQEYVLTEEPVGFAEPLIDRARWDRDGVLSVFVQLNEQPVNEGAPRELSTPVSIREWIFQ
jgi:hypothetical protein